jgi:hypothetical protein
VPPAQNGNAHCSNGVKIPEEGDDWPVKLKPSPDIVTQTGLPLTQSSAPDVSTMVSAQTGVATARAIARAPKIRDRALIATSVR